MKTLAVLLACLSTWLAIPVAAQTPPSPTNVPSFQLSFNVLNGPAGTVGMDAGATYGLTANNLLRADTFIFPGTNGNYFGAGDQYAPQFVCSLLEKTNLTCDKLQVYGNFSAGIDRVNVAGTGYNHAAGCGGAGANYDPSGTGKFSVNLVDFHLCRLPGLEQGWTAITAVGINVLGLGSNSQSMEVKRLRVLARERKKMLKLQKAAASAKGTQ